MKKIPILFNQIHVNQLPGIPRGLKPMTGLSGQINIIAGPNNSGKSSTARLIQQMLWHRGAPQTNAQASLHAGHDRWEIKVDGTHMLVQRNGADDRLTGRIPPAEGRKRYMLALHQMVNDEEKDLAKEIIKQTMGGYDLEAARETLQYSEKTKGKTISQHKTLTSAINQHRKILREQEQVKKQEDKLEDLRRKKEEADNARKKLLLLEKVIDYHNARNHLNETEQRKNSFPDEMKKVKGREHARLRELEDEKEEASRKIQEAKYEIVRKKNILEKLTIPEQGISEKTLNELESRLEKLKSCREEVARLEEDIREIKASKESLAKQIHPDIHSGQWEQFSLEDVSKLDKYVDEALEAIGQKEAIEKEVEYLEQELEETTEEESTDNLKKGLFALTQWLKAPAEHGGGIPPKFRMLLIMAGVGVTTALLTLIWGLAGMIAGGLLIVVVALVVNSPFFIRKKTPEKTGVRQQDYAETNLEEPRQWDAHHVIQQMEMLTQRLEAAMIREKRIPRLKKAKADLEKATSELEKVEKKYIERVEQLQENPLYKNGKKNYGALSYFLKKVNHWQEANVKLVSETEKKKIKEKRADEHLQEINSLFKVAGQEPVKGYEPAHAGYKEIRKQEEDRRNAGSQVNQLIDRVEDLSSRLDSLGGKRKKIYEELGVEEGDMGRVKELEGLLGSYKDVDSKHFAARNRLEEVRKGVEHHPQRGLFSRDLLAMEPHEAEEQQSQHHDMAEKAEAIIREISSIESRVKSIFERHQLEQALAEKDQAYEQLQEVYEENLASVTGHLILEKMNRAARQKNQSKVFQQANKLLTGITHGRYELQLDQSSEGSFRAYDTLLREGQELDKLSSGTRVQLLLAVRLAYVETQEGDYKLPLLADEVLANSDDHRAQTVIKALAEVSRKGRQVFFFTAKADEVAKWEACLSDQPKSEHKIIRLEMGELKIPPLSFKHPENISLTTSIPHPQNMDHEQFGRLIKVEPFPILSQTSAYLHLWYLISDVKLLHNCLQMGIERWGQLEAFMENDGVVNGLYDSQFQYMKELVHALDHFKKLYETGRPKPITREVLNQSGAVSEKYMDKLNHLLEKVQGNPEKLMKGLDNQGVKGFRTSKLEDLKQFLMDEGYLDDQAPMKMEDIQLKINAFISGKKVKPAEVEPFLKRVVESVSRQ